MDSTIFEAWFETGLPLGLPADTFIVMDNASFHRKKRLYSLASQANLRLLFLPPYSPDLDPIENYWAWLKRHLRKIISHHNSFDDAIHSAFKVN